MGFSLIPEETVGDEVPLSTLTPGTRFVMRTPEVWGLPESRTYGELLWSNSLRARVLIAGQPKQVAFPDSEGQVRVFDANGCCEVSWPLEVTVEPIPNTGEHTLAPNPPSGTADPAGRSNTMADEKVAQAAGIQARYDYNQKLLEKAQAAGDEAKATVIETKLVAILKEAEEKGVDIKTADVETNPAADGLADDPAVDAAHAPAKPTVLKPGATKKKPPSVLGAERASAISAIDKAKQKKAGGPAEPKAKPMRKTHDCLCGCGQETLSLFSPGHDARVKGIILKVERGDLDRNAIPDLCQPFVSFKGKWKTDGFVLTKSPVRIPNRPEVEHTGLAAMEALDV